MRKKRPWWVWVLLVIVALVIVGAIAGDPDEGSDDTTQADQPTTTPVEAGPTTATQTVPAQTIVDARRLVDDDDYPEALAIAATLGANEEDSIRPRIANRLGARALAAVRAGGRGRARQLIIDAQDFPNTARTRQARASYKSAKARAAQRRQAAAQQRRDQAEQREQAAQPTPEPQGGGCDPNYSGCVPQFPPDVNCPEVDGPVQVTGSDPHGLDRDGDGVACDN